MSWPPSWCRSQARNAFTNQIELEQNISGALTQLKSDQSNPQDLISALTSANSNVVALQSCFSDVFRHYPEFYNECRSEDSATANRVFDIPELLEMIVQNLDVLDLLSFYRCSRSIRDAIDASSKLQQQLSLRAAPADSHLRLPLRNFSKFSSGAPRNDEWGHLATPILQIGFSIYEHIGRGFPPSDWGQEKKTDTEKRTAEIHALFHLLPNQVLPRIGSHIRQMLITQPPINEITVSTDCCPSYDYASPSERRPVCQTIENLNGLTIGDLYDCTEKLLDEHRFCPSAHSGLLDDDGSVRIGVRFVGKKELHADDPIYIDSKRQERSREQGDRKRQKRAAKLEAFCNAKRNANANGERIPTLPEFVASHGDDADWQTLAWPHNSQFLGLSPFNDPMNFQPPRTILPAVSIDNNTEPSQASAQAQQNDETTASEETA